jgi:WXG100 family type VII secretion target
MSADTIQSQYEALDQVAQRFAQRAQAIQQMQNTMNRQTQRLAGTWQGRGSESFMREMQQVVFPAIQRLGQALEQSSATTKKINQVMKQAEDEASRLFQVSATPNIALNSNTLAASLMGMAVPGLGPILSALQGPASVISGLFKGIVADTLLNTRYVLRALTPNLARGNTTVAMLMDMLSGKPGKGLWAIRFDGPHGGTPFPHINLNPKISGFPKPDPHFPISPRLLNMAGTGARLLEGARRIALPVAIGVDVFRLGSAFHSDGNTIGSETKQTIGSVAGGWGGALGGAKLGAMGGAAIGSIFPGPGTVVGGVVGGLVGGIAGGIGGSWIGEQIGGLF